ELVEPREGRGGGRGDVPEAVVRDLRVERARRLLDLLDTLGVRAEVLGERERHRPRGDGAARRQRLHRPAEVRDELAHRPADELARPRGVAVELVPEVAQPAVETVPLGAQVVGRRGHVAVHLSIVPGRATHARHRRVPERGGQSRTPARSPRKSATIGPSWSNSMRKPSWPKSLRSVRSGSAPGRPAAIRAQSAGRKRRSVSTATTSACAVICASAASTPPRSRPRSCVSIDSVSTTYELASKRRASLSPWWSRYDCTA